MLWFPAPRSFTGEDCAELHLHGSRATMAAVMAAIGTLGGCRLAEPGEFTRRAFLNGKMDLAAVEGLADLIDAETDAQRKQALHQLDGSLGRWVKGLRTEILEAMALAEAAIDFADEGDVGRNALDEACIAAGVLALRIETELKKPHSGERIRDGFVVTIAGPPNAGKSTLLNALAQRDAAIVSPHAGTTRDPIEVDLDLGGYAVRLIDTAGLRASEDPVELEGIARAKARAATADLVLWLQPASEIPEPPNFGQTSVWTIGTKVDLAAGGSGFDLLISVRANLGFDGLLERLRSVVATELVGGESALVTRQRHRAVLQDTVHALKHADQSHNPELIAENLRVAAEALGRITGRIDVEEVLGAIFARFCIGK